MKNFLFVLLTCCLLVACSDDDKTYSVDPKDILGTWKSEITYDNPGGSPLISRYSIETYTADSTMFSKSFLKIGNDDFVEQPIYMFKYIAKDGILTIQGMDADGDLISDDVYQCKYSIKGNKMIFTWGYTDPDTERVVAYRRQ